VSFGLQFLSKDRVITPESNMWSTDTGSFRRKCQCFGRGCYRSCDGKSSRQHFSNFVWLQRWISWPNSVRFLFVGLDKGRSLEKKCGYTRRIARSYFGWCYLRQETWRSTQTKNTRTSHAICKVHWGWQWDFQTFFV